VKKNKYIDRIKILNPLILIIYGVTCYYLTRLARYGDIKRRVPIIILTLSLLIIWFTYSFYKRWKQKLIATFYPKSRGFSNHQDKRFLISKWWYRVTIMAIFFITFYTGYDIYQSSIPYNGKLSWYVHQIQSQKKIPYTHNNIYEDGLFGLIEDINKKIKLPEEIYIANDVALSFKEDGQITNFYGFLYGKNEKGETETFLLSYDEKQSEEIQVSLDNYLEETYDKDKLLQPLIDGLEYAPFKEIISDLNVDIFELYYGGFKTWPNEIDWKTQYYDENGLVSIDKEFIESDYVGYAFRIKELNDSEFSYIDFNFIHYDPLAIAEYEEQKTIEEAQAADPNYFPEEFIAEEYFLNENIGYQLVELDATLGTRFYGLRKTEDGGQNWIIHNSNPFLDRTGHAAGLTFMDEELGFIALSHNGASEADLYRTIDGGVTFKQVEIPSVSVTQNGTEFIPFDFPEMPFEFDGQLLLYVNQGSDGDYQNGAKAVFISNDNGKTFELVEIED